MTILSHKVHPFVFRLGLVTAWQSRWFHKKKFREYLAEDYALREFLFKHLDRSSTKQIEIERASNLLNIIIHTSRPGLVIGRGGAGVEETKRKVAKLLGNNPKTQIRIEIQEVRKPETHARLVGLSVAEQLEKRLPFRPVLKRAIERSMSTKEVKGIKILISGRLNGSEMARREWLDKGELPLQNLRADIDFAHVTARTVWGAIGVKVWLYRGEVFEDEK